MSFFLEGTDIHSQFGVGIGIGIGIEYFIRLDSILSVETRLKPRKN
jgi:hypothetical protein